VRGLIDGLQSPHPLGDTLPALFQQEDEFALRFTAALDEVLAPIMLALDNIDAYLDPIVAPPDFLAWLASWVGVELDETWTLDRQRQQTRQAVDLYRWSGTRRGLADTIKLYLDVEPEIIDNGGTSYSELPGGDMPGSPEPSLIVRITVPEGQDVDEGRLNELIIQSKPAYVPHRIEVVRT
jgi:phage tail-like protein